MIRIVSILFIITLIIIIYRKKREGFKNIKNQDYIISMFLTSGLCKEAENLIITLKRLNLQDKLIVTCLDKNADKCIKKLGVKTRLKELKLSVSANFGSKDFYDITYEKLVMIQELLEQTNKVVLYTDTDIVFLKDPSNDVNKFINSHDDVMFQDESTNFAGNSDYVCTGFMVFKPNENNIKLLKESQRIMKENWDNREWDNGGGADQKAVQVSVKKINNLNYSYFDAKDYPNGARYFDNVNTVYKDYTPVIIHNNFIKGLNNKIIRFKKHDLWFVEDNKNIFSIGDKFINEIHLYRTASTFDN